MAAMGRCESAGWLGPALVSLCVAAVPAGLAGQSQGADPASRADVQADAQADAPAVPGGAQARPAPRAGAEEATRQALSGDGRLVLVAQAEPPCLVVLDATRGEPVHALVPAARDGRVARRFAAVRTAPLRRSFIVAPADLPELWEISYDAHAEEIYDGLVHDYRFGEGVPRRGFLGLRRTSLPEPLADFVLDPHEAEAWGLAAAPPAGSGEGQVVNLDVRRRVAVRTAAEMRAAMAAMALPPSRAATAPQAAPQEAQRRTASRSWPCATPNVRTP